MGPFSRRARYDTEPLQRLMVFTHSYWPEHSPPQRRWSSFIKKFTESGWSVSVVAPVAHSKSLTNGATAQMMGKGFRAQTGNFGERIRRVPFLRSSRSRLGQLIDQTFTALLAIPVSMLEPRPSVVVVTVPSLPIAVTGYVVSKIRRVPLVVDMRDAWPDLARDARIVRSNAKSVIERIILGIQHSADLVVTVTQGFADVLRARGVANVVTISNGVDLNRLPVLPQRAQEERFRALYLGNHGASQSLEVPIRAAALVGDSMELVMVGSGVKKRSLQELAQKLHSPVTFLEPVSGSARVAEMYMSADTCIVSLRDDWKSFETTIPSKTYEVLAVGRHVTGIVKGEAENILRRVGVAEIVTSDPRAVAELWKRLKAEPNSTIVDGSGREWVKENANTEVLALRILSAVSQLVDTSSACTQPDTVER